jgi:hypothetical protein
LETAVRAEGHRRSCVRADRLDLGSVPDDRGVESDGLEVSVAHLCDAIRDEACEGTAQRWSLLEDDEAGQPRLEALQHESLVERLLIMHGRPPIRVVVLAQQGMVLGPPAAHSSVAADLQTGVVGPLPHV